MKITLLTVGKIKEKFYIQAIEEFQKRLSRYCKLEILEVPDEKTPDNAGEALEGQIKIKEGERLLKLIKDSSYVITLDLKGTMMSSEQMAQNLEKLGIGGTSHIVFIIGGSLGLSKEVLEASHERLCFSKMTFPHQLMRVILLEQIYRCFRIIQHEPYHK